VGTDLGRGRNAALCAADRYFNYCDGTISEYSTCGGFAVAEGEGGVG